jgi:hypothetical protein
MHEINEKGLFLNERANTPIDKWLLTLEIRSFHKFVVLVYLSL